MAFAERRRALAVGVALGICAGAAGAEAVEPDAAQAQAAARATVTQTVDAVLAILRDDSRSTAAKREAVEALAYERFDFQTIAKLVLARNWRRFEPAQRTAFVDEFKRHLSLTYGDNLSDYGEEDVEVTDTRMERNGDVTVRTHVLGRGPEPILIDYRLRNKGSGWRVIDVIIEGVSMISNFRSQTQEIISRKGPEGLIEQLREKNAARTAEES